MSGAAHQLAARLWDELRRAARSGSAWGVAVRCVLRPDIALLYGNQQSGFGSGGPPNPCVGRAINDYQRHEDDLQEALRSAAKLLADCCT